MCKCSVRLHEVETYVADEGINVSIAATSTLYCGVSFVLYVSNI